MYSYFQCLDLRSIGQLIIEQSEALTLRQQKQVRRTMEGKLSLSLVLSLPSPPVFLDVTVLPSRQVAKCNGRYR